MKQRRVYVLQQSSRALYEAVGLRKSLYTGMVLRLLTD